MQLYETIIITFIQNIAFRKYPKMSNGLRKLMTNSNYLQTITNTVLKKCAHKNNIQSYKIISKTTTILQK